MSGPQSFLSSYRGVLSGLVLVLLGATFVGLSLSFAGEDGTGAAMGFGLLAFASLVIGFVVLVAAFRRRGGLLRSRVTDAERVTYRSEYREGGES